MPNVNVTYAEMQGAARQPQAGEQTISGDLSRLKRLVDQFVMGGYVTDSSSKHFQASYGQFNTGATKMISRLAVSLAPGRLAVLPLDVANDETGPRSSS